MYGIYCIGFVCTITLWGKAILTFVNVVLLPFTKNNRIANTLITDTRLRTVLVTIPGMGLNLIYAIFNGVIGFMNLSAWYVSLAVYYLLLCVMRFLAVAYAGRVYQVKVTWRKRNQEKEDSPESGQITEREVPSSGNAA